MKQRQRFMIGNALLILFVCVSCQNLIEPQRVELSSHPDSLIAGVRVKIAEKKQLQEDVERFRQRRLPSNFDKKIKEYNPIIRKYSQRYGIDWRLIIAQILKESYFIEDARSHVGAMGLMQIMPRTAREIRGELDIEYIAKDPRENITAGIYHMYKQLKYFQRADPENQIKLALAAYNGGPGRVLDAQTIARHKGLDPNTWEAVRACLPLLTTADWKLHLEVWKQGTPARGYFFGFDQTIGYVDDIYANYQLITEMF